MESFMEASIPVSLKRLPRWELRFMGRSRGSRLSVSRTTPRFYAPFVKDCSALPPCLWCEVEGARYGRYRLLTQKIVLWPADEFGCFHSSREPLSQERLLPWAVLSAQSNVFLI